MNTLRGKAPVEVVVKAEEEEEVVSHLVLEVESDDVIINPSMIMNKKLTSPTFNATVFTSMAIR